MTEKFMTIAVVLAVVIVFAIGATNHYGGLCLN